jgi:hypothetical protein
MQHTIVTVALVIIHDMFRPCTAIIRCPRYAKLFTALFISILKLKFNIKQIALLNLVKTVSITLLDLLA